MELSLNWAKRSRDAFSLRGGYGQFGIVQGSVFSELREISALELKIIYVNVKSHFSVCTICTTMRFRALPEILSIWLLQQRSSWN